MIRSFVSRTILAVFHLIEEKREQQKLLAQRMREISYERVL